jgi:uncharacterized protein
VAGTGTKKIWKWLWYTFLVYAVIGIALYFLQDYILFRPVSLNRDQRYDFKLPHNDISIPVNERDTLNLVDFTSTAAQQRGLVIYFHGNRKNISWYARYIPLFTRHGYRVYMIDYPGYGKSTGRLTEQKLYDWALLAYKLALKEFPADSIIIYGKSMGTGIAAQLASVRDCKRLILETPYYDFPSIVQHYLPVYPVRWLLKYQLPVYRYLPNVTTAVTLLHGTNDHVVTYKNSLKLKKYLKAGDELITVKGGKHNNLFSFPLVNRKLDSVLLLP